MSSSSARVNVYDNAPPAVPSEVVLNGPDNVFQRPPSLPVRMVAELIGTCLFVFFGASSVVNTDGNLLIASIAHALATIWLVYVFGPVSGGHFNAGATVAFAINGKMKIVEIIGYLGAQAIGCLVGGLLVLALYGTGSTLGTPTLADGVPLMRGFASEFICTTVLSFVIFFTTTYNAHKEAAFPIGLVVFSSFLIGANRDGSALNPWRWFGPAVVSGTFRSEAWIYIVGPIGGFILGYGLFRLYKLLWNRGSYQQM